MAKAAEKKDGAKPAPKKSLEKAGKVDVNALQAQVDALLAEAGDDGFCLKARAARKIEKAIDFIAQDEASE